VALRAGDAEAGTQGISFDDALTKYVGEFGKGQVSSNSSILAGMETAGLVK
jgi:hypothetical protein